jgi:hypothetical protein
MERPARFRHILSSVFHLSVLDARMMEVAVRSGSRFVGEPADPAAPSQFGLLTSGDLLG